MKKKDSTPNLKTNIIVYFIIQLISYLCPLILAPYVSRTLTATGVGNYAFASSIASYFGLIIVFGFTTYGTKAISEQRDKPQKVSSIFWNVFFARLLFFVIAAASYGIIVFNFNLNVDIQNRIYLAFYIMLAGNAIDITYLYQGLERIKLYSLISVIVNVVYIISVFIWVKSIDDLLVYTILKSSVLFVTSAISWIMAYNIINRPQIDRVVIKSAIIQSFFFFIPSLITRITPVIDQTMLGALANTTQVGFYEQANKIKLLVASFVFALAPIMMSRISYLNCDSKDEEVKLKLSKAVYVSVYFMLPAMAGLYCISKYFFPAYFGEEFVSSVPVMYWLLPSMVFSSLATLLLNGYYYAYGKVKFATILLLCCDSLNLFTNYFFIQELGAVGAAFTSSFSNGILCILCILFSRKQIDYLTVVIDGFRIMVSVVFMVGSILIINKLIESFYSNSIISLIDIFVGSIVYIIVCLVIKERFTVEIVASIKKVIKKR